MGENKNKRVLLALDGGIDSAVAGGLLKVQGYDIIAINIRVWDQDDENFNYPKTSYNCAGIAFQDTLREICKVLQIPLQVISVSEKFLNKVIENYIYKRIDGIDFFACKECLNTVVLRSLLTFLHDFNAEKVATGDFLRVTYNSYENHYSVWRSKNEAFDSSRIFYNFSQSELACFLFPIGDLGIEEIKVLANEFNLSQIIRPRTGVRVKPCFLHNIDSDKLVERYLSKSNIKLLSGNIVDFDKKILKKHDGLYKFSIGQKPHVKLSGKNKKFVTDIDLKSNCVQVGLKQNLYCQKVLINNVNIISIPKLKSREEFMAETMDGYRTRCLLEAAQDNKIIIEFFKQEHGFWSGKEVAIYDNNLLIGGGIVEKIIK